MEERLMPLLTILISAIVVFIIGQILGRKTECVILYKKWDAWVLTIWGWAFIIWIICSMTSLLGNNAITVFMVLFAVFGVALLITSVISNLHHGWLSVIYIIVSLYDTWRMRIPVSVCAGSCNSKSPSGDDTFEMPSASTEM